MRFPSPLRSSAALTLFLVACGGATTTSGSTTGTSSSSSGGGSGGSGGGTDFTCAADGVSKGPWSLAVDGSSAIVRWEACRAGTAGGLQIKPEAGGSAKAATSVEAAVEITVDTKAPLSPSVTPDAAGTYYSHEAKLTGLAAGACYTYQLDVGTTHAGRFCTARPSGTPYNFLFLGDTNPGLSDAASKIIAEMVPKNPDFTLHGGDIQYYASGLETYASWFPPMEPLLAHGAFFPAIGNHESEQPTEYADYVMRYFGHAGFDWETGYYRFESGGVWFFALNTELSMDVGSAQQVWIEKELADAKAQPGFRFSVVYFHKPWVTCGDAGDNPVARAYFEPIFIQQGVKIVMQAHMHGYERFEFPGNDGGSAPKPPGITYVTSAGGGGALQSVDMNKSRAYCDKRVKAAAIHNAVLFNVKAASLDATVLDEFGKVQDTFSTPLP